MQVFDYNIKDNVNNKVIIIVYVLKSINLFVDMIISLMVIYVYWIVLVRD